MKMHLVRDLLLSSACFISIVSADCYSDGDQWPNTEDATKKVTLFCGEFANSVIAPGVYKSTCVNGPSGFGIRYNFDIRNVDTTPAFFSESDCIDALFDLVDCPFGGFWASRGDFFYNADPNLGLCD